MARPFHEFFAGSGMVSCGLSGMFDAVWANDISSRKRDVYIANLGEERFHLGDVSLVHGPELPPAQLSWASFPCQDLSLAGKIGGIHSERSGLVWQWLRIVDELGDSAPRVICLENVAGLMSSRHGDDYRTLHAALSKRGYRVGAVLLNADKFVPQSRPRVFVIATRGEIPSEMASDGPTWLQPAAVSRVGLTIDGFVWWSAEAPRAMTLALENIVEPDIAFDKQEVVKLVTDAHRRKFVKSGREYATGYRRTRNGRQVVELRCDGIAGCLRTPAGGSSRQYLFHRGKNGLEARLLTVREVARLMGAPDSWMLPGSYNDGYFAMGDAVVAPVVRWLGRNFLEPLTEAAYGNQGIARQV